jgi:hypothetical protein
MDPLSLSPAEAHPKWWRQSEELLMALCVDLVL